ncbi:carbon-nitrogen family hydrolase [Alcanivorax sp. S71-1-4]|uniref:amidohydrolase n=1 Tax=Alcanivorax sp. S71-1-4 TaxID=1177159 RepID=UPI00135CCB6C|nr:amidohydrolase [Alcanivorax sp. S71-1-4]KAF0805979.1 carbon-nitrogen family hydrolase [Alcanivorax sp. S71-1-4]
MNDLTLALVQTTLHWEDHTANLSDFDALLPAAQGADVVILPEMFTTGFSMAPERLAEAADGPTRDWLLGHARALDAAITGSVIVRTDSGQYVNRLYWAQPDGTLLHYDKRHLFRMAGEHEHYAAGTQQLALTWRGWRIRPLICYDLRFPVWSRASDTDLLLYVANWPAPRRLHWLRLLAARGIENLCYSVGVNRIGDDGKGVPHSGDSVVCDFQGETLLDAESEDGVFHTTLSASALQQYRERFPAWRDADRFTLTP